MYIQPISKSDNVNFGLKVSIDKKILNQAKKEELGIINNLKRELSNIRMDGEVLFEAVQDAEGKIVNIAHKESNIPLPKMYKKNQSFSVGDFIDFLNRKRDWYENRFHIERDVEAAFGN